LAELPCDIAVDEVVAPVNTAASRDVAGGRDDGRAFGPMRVAGELLMAAGHVPAFEEELGAVGESVFDRVAIEVLIDVVAAVSPAAGSLGLHRPGVLHPATLIDVVNQEVAIRAAAGPEERMEFLDLVKQFVVALSLRTGEACADRTLHAIGAQERDLTDLAVL